jgi:adsorption protein B
MADPTRRATVVFGPAAYSATLAVESLASMSQNPGQKPAEPVSPANPATAPLTPAPEPGKPPSKSTVAGGVA